MQQDCRGTAEEGAATRPLIGLTPLPSSCMAAPLWY